MKYFIIVKLVLFSIFANSQDLPLEYAEYKRRVNSRWGSYGMLYGQNLIKANDFTKYFKDNYNSSFGKQFNSISLETNRKFNYSENTYMNILYYLPSTIFVNDTLSYSLNGFNVEMVFFRGFNLFYTKHFDFPLSLGFNAGSFYLKENSTKLRNPFFSLALRLNPKVIIFKRIVLSSAIKLNWDVSKPTWKSKEEYEIENLNYKNNSLSFQIGVAYIIHYFSDYVRIY